MSQLSPYVSFAAANEIKIDNDFLDKLFGAVPEKPVDKTVVYTRRGTRARMARGMVHRDVVRGDSEVVWSTHTPGYMPPKVERAKKPGRTPRARKNESK